MKQKIYFLGIDSSNYTTSVAIVDIDNNIIYDGRKILPVEKGKRGIRQSDGFFCHIRQFPELLDKVFDIIQGSEIKAVGCSTRPRPVEGSYMPVFLAGESIGNSIASALGVQCYNFSHQEGHIESLREFLLPDAKEFIAFHLSGGTTEILKVKYSNGYKIEVIGGTKDISFGQLIDRIGVSLGYDFPCGANMDNDILENENIKGFSKVKIKDSYFNLSGLESEIQRHILKSTNIEGERRYLVTLTFSKVLETLQNLILEIRHEYQLPIVLVGGVAESSYIRKNLKEVIFGNLSKDNGVGIALMAKNKYLNGE